MLSGSFSKDMVFKPVPDSKLDRKRAERLRKAAEREEQMRAAEAAKHNRLDIPGIPPGRDTCCDSL